MHAIYVLINFYNKYSGDDVHKKYIKYRLEGQMWGVYKMFLCENMNVDLSPLFEFDDKIKRMNNEIYLMANSYLIGKVGVVNRWRRKKYKNSGLIMPIYYGVVHSYRNYRDKLFGMRKNN